MIGKTSEELFGPPIRGENTAHPEMFALVSDWFCPPQQGALQESSLNWVAQKSVDEVVAELHEPEVLASYPTGAPTVYVSYYEKAHIYVFKQDGRTFTYHHILP